MDWLMPVKFPYAVGANQLVPNMQKWLPTETNVRSTAINDSIYRYWYYI